MKPIKFKEQNVTYAENQPEYFPLPAHKDINGIVTSCWKLSFKERIRVLFKGNIWLCLWSFNKPLTPSYMTTRKKDLFVLSDSEFTKVVKKNIKLFKDLRAKYSTEINKP
jgi:hypothetical protein